MAQTSEFAIEGQQAFCGCAACVASRDLWAPESELTQPSANIPALAPLQAPYYAIDAVINPYDYKWNSMTPGVGATVSYSFLASVPNYYTSNADERDNFVAMNGVQKQAARDAFLLFSEAANITFVEVAPGTGAINLGTANLGSGVGGWAYYPGAGTSGTADNSVRGDVWITNQNGYGNPVKGTWEYATYIHEIGHAIGLKHPGNYDAGGGGTDGPYLPTPEDSNQFTIMSYYSGPTFGSLEPITPQIYDVAAVQYLYGARASTRSGNDTYTFSTSTQIRTIWDGGGTDTFDASNQLSAVSIDLRAGGFSSIAGTYNVAIAFNASIERAIGSSYNDTLRANDDGSTLTGGAGNDTLFGGAGTDTLIGGTGNDTYYINSSTDVITESPGQGTDTVFATASITLADNVENLTLGSGASAINGTGNSGNNTIIGNESANRLSGGAGADTLTGGGGADVFVYVNADSGLENVTRDLITDFLIGQDLFDLTGFDADPYASGINPFRFLGLGAFAGQPAALHYFYDAARGVTVLEGDLGGDLIADFGIDILGNVSLTREAFSAGSIQLQMPLNLVGTPGMDTLVGDDLGDTLFGRMGADTLLGGLGDDSYGFNRGDGIDTIYDDHRTSQSYSYQAVAWQGWTTPDAYYGSIVPTYGINQTVIAVDGGGGVGCFVGYSTVTGIRTVRADGGNDTLSFGSGILATDVSIALSGNDLVVGITDSNNPSVPFDQLTDKIILQNWSDPLNRIETFKFADGSTLDLAGIASRFGTNNSDTFVWTETTANIAGGSGNDAITTGAFSDTLDGGIAVDAPTRNGGVESALSDSWMHINPIATGFKPFIPITDFEFI